MGLLDKINKAKEESNDRINKAKKINEESKWYCDGYRTVITLNDTNIEFERARKTTNIFYKDIKNIEKRVLDIKIKTTTDEYKISSKSIRGGSDLVDDLYSQILEKMNNQNAPATPNTNIGGASFCGNCGQALNGENFCPNCGTEVRKIN